MEAQLRGELIQLLKLENPKTSFLRTFLDWTIIRAWSWQVYALTCLEFLLILELFAIRDLVEACKTIGHLLLLPKFFYYVFVLESFTLVSEFLKNFRYSNFTLKLLLRVLWPVFNILVPGCLLIYANHWTDVVGLLLVCVSSFYKYAKVLRDSFLRELGHTKRNV
jgi:hypothetical protein